MNGRTYCGFYKGHYLKSTLEYIYAKYLDHIEIEWDYEVKTFSLSNGGSYKPDFYIVSTNSFVEVKGSFNYDADLPRITRFQSETGYKVQVIQDADIRNLIKQTPYVFNQLAKEWKEQANGLGMDISGSNNPRYGVKMADSTKRKISEKAKVRFENPEYRNLIAESIRQSPGCAANRQRFTEWRQSIKMDPYTQVCKACGKEFTIKETWQKNNNQRFCSRSCSAKTLFTKSTVNSHQVLQAIALEYAQENTEALSIIKLNKVKEVLEGFYEKVTEATGIEDPRTICKSLGIKSSRKELALYLHSLAENVLGANAN